MSQELFIAVAQSNIQRVRTAIRALTKTRGILTINNELYPKQTILDIATQEAKEHRNSPEHPSNAIVTILREAGAILFSEIAVPQAVPQANQEEAETNYNNILGGNEPVPVSPAPPPKPPLYPVGQPASISNGIALRATRRGGRKRNKNKKKTKAKKSRKHLRR
jgi:hypothetical protein